MRKKATTFWSSAPVVQSLSLRCHEGLGHKHLPWGRQGQGWSTAEEVAYPQTLCRHWASLVLAALEDVGLMLKRENQPGTASFAAAERASLGFFPKATQQWTRLPTGPSLSLELGSMTPSSPRVPRPSRSPCTKVRGGPLWDSQSRPEALLQRSHGCTPCLCLATTAASLGEDREQPKQPTPV